MRNLNHALFAALALASILLAPGARAAVTPISIAIIPPVQFPPESFSVAGVRASAIWGEHRYVYGVDLGLIGNMTSQGFGGIGVSGIFNRNKGVATVVGLQAAGFGNFNVGKTSIYGLQVAAGVNSNMAEASMVGFQLAAANHSPHMTIGGAQFGIYNRAREVYGLQIGLVNFAQSLHGFQIGLLNFHEKGLFPVAPILNFGF